VAKSDRETVPQTWSSDSEGEIAETSALNDTRIDKHLTSCTFITLL